MKNIIFSIVCTAISLAAFGQSKQKEFVIKKDNKDTLYCDFLRIQYSGQLVKGCKCENKGQETVKLKKDEMWAYGEDGKIYIMDSEGYCDGYAVMENAEYILTMDVVDQDNSSFKKYIFHILDKENHNDIAKLDKKNAAQIMDKYFTGCAEYEQKLKKFKATMPKDRFPNEEFYEMIKAYNSCP